MLLIAMALQRSPLREGTMIRAARPVTSNIVVRVTGTVEYLSVSRPLSFRVRLGVDGSRLFMSVVRTTGCFAVGRTIACGFWSNDFGAGRPLLRLYLSKMRRHGRGGTSDAIPGVIKRCSWGLGIVAVDSEILRGVLVLLGIWQWRSHERGDTTEIFRRTVKRYS